MNIGWQNWPAGAGAITPPVESGLIPPGTTQDGSPINSAILVPSLGDDRQVCRVARGDLIATLETRKATLDAEAEANGWLHHATQEGVPVAIGDSIGFIEHDGRVRQGGAWIQMLNASRGELPRELGLR